MGLKQMMEVHPKGLLHPLASRHRGVCLGQQQQERCWTIFKPARKMKATQVARKLMHLGDWVYHMIYTGIQAATQHFVSHLDKFLFVVNR